eukprot:g9299.t1
MNFGSKFALHDDSGEEEVVNEQDMASGPLGAAGAAGGVPPPPSPQAGAAGTAAVLGASPTLPARTWTRKIDTNVLNVDMAALSDETPYATGDPIACSGCRAYLSAVSVLTPVDVAGDDIGGNGDAYVWSCEFCHQNNSVRLDGMEKPADGVVSVEYLIDGAPPGADKSGGAGGAAGVAHSGAITDGKGTETGTGTGKGKRKEKRKDRGSGKPKEDKSAVLFVVDTSGSMSETSSVQGKLKLRGAEEVSLLERERGNREGTTNISRLQFMQAAVDSQLETMTKETPSRCAGLVTFAAAVSLIGDANTDNNHDHNEIQGSRLSDEAALRKDGRAAGPLLSLPVSKARPKLSERLFQLRPRGETALGPAVVAGLSMLKERDGGGSRLVLCTDGHANRGIGSLSNFQSTEEREAVETFYEELGRESKEIGVTIDVVSMDSKPCDLENLGAMADVSGGTVTRVSASDLTSNFAGILANPILACQVLVRVVLHKGLMFRNVDEVGTDASTFFISLGNVTHETELSFEYQVRDKAERVALGLDDDPNGTLSSPTVKAPLSASASDNTAATAQRFLPFQVQIHYTRLDGKKRLRVLTNVRAVTNNKAEAEKFISMETVAGHAASQAGDMAGKGAYQSARVSLRAWGKFMQRNATTPETEAMVQRYASKMTALDNEVAQAQNSESLPWNTGGSVDHSSESAMFGRARKTARTRSDGFSHRIFSAKGIGRKRISRVLQ